MADKDDFFNGLRDAMAEALFTVEWCEACECAFVRCSKCGNNCCNAMHGTVDGAECDVCPLAYQYQELWNELHGPVGKEFFGEVVEKAGSASAPLDESAKSRRGLWAERQGGPVA